MVDIFGGRPRLGGIRGPRGLPGIAGSINDFCKWLPNSILSQLQTHEEFCFLLSSPSDVARDKDDKVTQWICRNKKRSNIIAEIAGDLIEVFGNGYALDFQRNRYKSIKMTEDNLI